MYRRLYANTIEDDCETFWRHGAVVINPNVNKHALQAMEGRLDEPSARSSRGTGRHCINNSRNTDLDGYKAIMDNENLNGTITAITNMSRGLGRTGEWSWGKAGGDIVDPHTDTYQPLHTDWTGYPLESMAWGFAIVVSVPPRTSRRATPRCALLAGTTSSGTTTTSLCWTRARTYCTA